MSRRGPQPRGLARSRAGLLFALGMAVSLVSVDLVAQPDPVSTGRPVLHEKVHALRTRAATPDIIFVGNSHVHRTVVPSVFDERMATLGCNLSSYNLGIVGLRRNELPAVLDAVGSLPGGPPTYLVIGPVLEVDITYNALGDLTARSFYRREDIPALLERWTAIDGVGGRHLPFVAAVYMAAQVPVGALHHRLHPERAEPTLNPPLIEASMQDGYLSLEAESDFDPLLVDRQAALADFVTSGAFAAAIDPDRDATIDPAPFVARWADRVDRVGSSVPIILQQPTVYHREAAQVEAAFRSRYPGVAVVNLARPDRLPQDRDPSQWFDRTHVREEFAAAASIELAEQMCPLIGGHTEAD